MLKLILALTALTLVAGCASKTVVVAPKPGAHATTHNHAHCHGKVCHKHRHGRKHH